MTRGNIVKTFPVPFAHTLAAAAAKAAADVERLHRRVWMAARTQRVAEVGNGVFSSSFISLANSTTRSPHQFVMGEP
jgi:hypothetical protein